MGLFEAAHGWGGGSGQKGLLPKICDIYSTVMRLGTVILYLKKNQKIYKSRDILLKVCWHLHFFTGDQQVLLYQERKM